MRGRPGVWHSLCVLALAAGANAAERPRLHLRAVDSWTGAAVSAEASLVPVPRDSAGGRSRVRLTAPGYRALSADFDLSAAADWPMTFELDPVAAPREVAESVSLARARGMGLLHGFVTESGTARALAGVTVRLRPSGDQTVTNASGYFRLLHSARPALGALSFRLDGHEEHEITGVLLQAGDTLFREALTLGEGRTARDDRPKVLRSPEELVESQSAPHPPDDLASAPRAEPLLPVVIDPPDTIRVGTSCSCTTCSAVSVMSLETYVRRGLNDEWIASWNAHSLRAGAVAYRSYGSYYALHPMRANYDICSTACCQVNDTDTSNGTNLATDRTAGYVLERSGSIFRAEYSAENNAWDDPSDGLSCANADLSCGDGFAGSPAASWPCLTDPEGTGHGCFGHGRGACQWGTQRWATAEGKRWNWIVDHYYNDNGAGSGLRTSRLTTPMTVAMPTPSATEVAPGQTFSLSSTATSAAEVAHTHVLLGASLSSAATGDISDPPRDVLVTLAPGANEVSRSFVVPAATPNGVFDLLVALYDDVDENGAIGSSDVALHLATRAAALRVCGPVAAAISGRDQVPVGLQARLEATAGFASYQWFQEDSSIPGATGAVLVTPPLSSASTFRVDVADGAGCAGSAQKTLGVTAPSFADVPASDPFYPYVEAVARDGITSGCAAGGYCPAAPVSRGQMAPLLLRAKEGGAYVPPSCTSAVFDDVPCGHIFAAWIQELAARGVTSGCGDGNYCPDAAVTRAQMAVFLLRTLLGSAYVPPACASPAFADVPCSDPFAAWINDLVARGVTSGCGGGNYCPTQAVSRGQAAVFLVRTFGISVVW